MNSHLTDLLKHTGQTAMVWDIGADTISWVGDAPFIGAPHSGSAFKKLMNPQDLPAFMSELQGRVQALELGEKTEDLSVMLRLNGADGLTHHFRLQGHITLAAKDNNPIIHALLIDARLGRKLRLEVDETGEEVAVEDKGREAIVEHIERARLTKGVDTNQGFLFVLGLDRVRLLNTAYGATAVDLVLDEVEKRLKSHVGATAFVSRLSGDNFGIVHGDLPMTGVSGYITALQQLFRSQPFRTLYGAVTLGLTVGVTPLMASDCRNAQDVLVQAETALHEAKIKGRGTSQLARPRTEKQIEAQHLLTTSQHVLQALDEGRMRLAFQPVVNIDTNSPSFYECLIRMIDEQGAIIPAAQFVPALETLGLMRALDIFSLKAAVAELEQYADLRLSVNVSATSLTDEAWVRTVVACLGDAPAVAARLIIEITESAAMVDIERASQVLASIKAMGAKVALDDFGAGQTSFRQLKKLGVSIVKIDRDFVRDQNDPVNRLFINALYTLAKGLGIETVAEGAETLEDAGSLQTQGITHIQGYAYGQPSIHRLWIDDTAERAMANLPMF